MESFETNVTTTNMTAPPLSPSSPYEPSSPPAAAPPPVVVSPCAACKILRRRCAEKCVLAPYFPPTDPLKFATAHRVYGASNIIKLLQELPEFQREDAVSSMVYEANARLRDPVYGSAGAISQLHRQVNELQAQLAKTQVELVNMHCQQSNLMTLICMEMAQSPEASPQHQYIDDFINYQNNLTFMDENTLIGTTFDESLWT